MCMLQGDVIVKDLIYALPSDVQALVLIHNGNANHNITGKNKPLTKLKSSTTEMIIWCFQYHRRICCNSGI